MILLSDKYILYITELIRIYKRKYKTYVYKIATTRRNSPTNNENKTTKKLIE